MGADTKEQLNLGGGGPAFARCRKNKPSRKVGLVGKDESNSGERKWKGTRADLRFLARYHTKKARVKFARRGGKDTIKERAREKKGRDRTFGPIAHRNKGLARRKREWRGSNGLGGSRPKKKKLRPKIFKGQ